MTKDTGDFLSEGFDIVWMHALSASWAAYFNCTKVWTCQAV